MGTELHLIGTLAHDPDGPDRLVRLLDEVQPDALALEASRSAFERQSATGDRAGTAVVEAITTRGADADTVAFWRRRLAKEQWNYEAFTTAAYATRHARPLHFLDRSPGDAPLPPPGAAQAAAAHGPPDAARDDPENATAAFQFADLETLHGIAAFDWRGDYARNYARARVDLEAKACLEFLLPVAQQAAYRVRARSMARRLVPLLGAQEHRRVAVVCALTQLYFSEARLTLYAQLYDGVAQRYITDEFGAIRDHPIVLPWERAGTREHHREAGDHAADPPGGIRRL